MKRLIVIGGPRCLRRFSRSKENFWNIYRNAADLWFLFYNSDATIPIVPNVYSRNGVLYFELPNGEITQKNPFED